MQCCINDATKLPVCFDIKGGEAKWSTPSKVALGIFATIMLAGAIIGGLARFSNALAPVAKALGPTGSIALFAVTVALFVITLLALLTGARCAEKFKGNEGMPH